MLIRVAAGLAGLAAAAVGSWGVLSSSAGIPQFSWRRRFISDIATPWNPYADRLNQSLVIAGALITVFAALVVVRTRSRGGFTAAVATGITGLGAIGVGLFPLTNLGPHLGAAVVAGGAALVASIAAGRTARRSTRDGPPGRRLFGLAAAGLSLLAAGCVLTLVGYFLWVSARVWPGSVSELLRVLPRELLIVDGTDWYNPLAMLEWAFFSVLGCQLIGFAVAELAGAGDRPPRSGIVGGRDNGGIS